METAEIHEDWSEVHRAATAVVAGDVSMDEYTGLIDRRSQYLVQLDAQVGNSPNNLNIIRALRAGLSKILITRP